MAKVAIALFVKNEGTDIAGWIAWHLALGIDALFIFDDYSSDGTWEIIQAASRSFNVRAYRSDVVGQPYFYWRQRDCYMKAAEMAKGQFDWIGYLDGDEYFYPVHADNIGSFFDQFEHADGVAVSWCIYGSSDRVVRPRNTTIEAFRAHSTTELGDNSLVKSFVRPEKLGQNYTDPHRFDIPEERYVDTKGQQVVWNGATKNIDWDDAKILHYICRSMEHYTQRIRRRLNADLGDSQAYWNHFNRNDIVDNKPLRFVPTMNLYLNIIYRNSIDIAIDQLLEFLQVNPKHSETIAHEARPAVKQAIVTRVSTVFNTFLCMDTKNNTLLCVSQEDFDQSQDLTRVYAAMYQSTPQLIVLYVLTNGKPDFSKPIYALEDGRVSAELVYSIKKSRVPERVSLQNPVTGRYLSAVPFSDNGSRQRCECNRNEPSEWEEFSLILEQDIPYEEENVLFPLVPEEGLSVKDICKWIISSSEKPNTSEFMRAIYLMSPSERERLKNIIPGLLFSLF